MGRKHSSIDGIKVYKTKTENLCSSKELED